jgi:hypothetical protein
LEGERDRQRHRHAQLAALVHKVVQWHSELKPNVALELAPAIDLDLKMPLNEALGAIRREIASLARELQSVRAAPLPPQDQKALAAAFVASLVRQARPTIGIARDQLTLRWSDDVIASRSDILAMMAWIDSAAVLDALCREIDRQPLRGGALAPVERTTRAAELVTALDRHERTEEALVGRAAPDGIEVLRRPDASPAAVLGVVVAARAQAQVA